MAAPFRKNILHAILPVFLITLFLSSRISATPLNGVRFEASLGAMSDTGNVAGFRADATEKFDSGIDLPEPPAPIGGYLLLYLHAMEGANEAFTRFRTDYRGTSPTAFDSTRTWDLTVSTDQTYGTVLLKATLGESLPSGLPVYLFDGSVYHNLRLVDTLEYSALGNASRTFTLYIGEPGAPDVKIDDPFEGADLLPSTEHSLLWNGSSVVCFTKTLVETSLDGGTSWTTLAERDSLLTTLAWTTPDTVVQEGVLRVSLTDSLGREATDEAHFTVAESIALLTGVELLTPLDGDAYTGGDSLLIDWRWLGGGENLTESLVETSLDGGSSWSTLNTRSDTVSSQLWVLPSSLYTEQAAVRVTAIVDVGTPYADSTVTIRIRPKQFSNRSFEDWTVFGEVEGPPDSWAVSGGDYGGEISVVANLTDANVLEGDMSAQVDVSSGKTATLVQECYGALPGVDYTMTLGVLDQAAAGSAQISLYLLDGNGSLLTGNASVSSVDGSAYQELSTSVTAPSGTEILRVEIQVSAMLASQIFLDDVTIIGLEPVPDVSFTSPASDTVFDVDGTSEMPVSWDYNGTSGIVSSAVLELSMDGGSWQALASYTDGETCNHSWAGIDTFTYDSRLRLRAENASGLADTAVSARITLRPTHREVQLPGGWHLFALPLQPEDPSVAAVIGDDVADTALVYAWTTTAGYVPVDTLEALRGYWLALNSSTTLDVDGEAPLDTQAVLLDGGWNLMLNPYPCPMQTSALLFRQGEAVYSFQDAHSAGLISSPLYGYDPVTLQYAPRSADANLPSFQGFWIWTFAEDVSLLFSPEHLTSSAEPQAGGSSRETNGNGLVSWVAPLLLRSGYGVSRNAVFGVDPAADWEIDPGLDGPAPPDDPAGAIPRVLWVRDEEAALRGFRLLRDLLPAMSGEDTVRVWTALIRPGAESRLDLDAGEAVASLPDGWRLEWESDGVRRDAALEPLYRWRSGETSDTVRVWLTSPSSLEPPQETPLPERFTLSSVYPNPFNGALRITFGVHDPVGIGLTVYNLVGRCVYHRPFSEFPAGWHTLIWNSEAASGVYIIQLRTSHGEREMRRVILLR